MVRGFVYEINKFCRFPPYWLAVAACGVARHTRQLQLTHGNTELWSILLQLAHSSVGQEICGVADMSVSSSTLWKNLSLEMCRTAVGGQRALLPCSAARLQLFVGFVLLLPCVTSAAKKFAEDVAHCTCPQVPDLLPQRQRATNITVCAIFRNEAGDLFEWITYHWLLGMSHFVLYDNDSTDAPERVLAPFLTMGIVTLKKWPGQKNQHPTPQSRSLEDCKLVAESLKIRWLTAFDIDEFLVLKTIAGDRCADPRHDGSWSSELHSILTKLEKRRIAGIVASRFDFGTNEVMQRITRQMQTATFTRRSSSPSSHGKPVSLVRKIKRFSGFHAIEVASKWSVLMCNDLSQETGCPFEFFHFKTRSLQECIDKSTDPRLPKSNWRAKVGEDLCKNNTYSELLDVSLAESSLVACVATNVALQATQD